MGNYKNVNNINGHETLQMTRGSLPSSEVQHPVKCSFPFVSIHSGIHLSPLKTHPALKYYNFRQH